MSSGRHGGIIKLALVAVCAFALTFALVPLYRIACEKVFGIRLDNTAASVADISAATIPAVARMVTVEFDASVNSKLPWTFHPREARMQVQLGQVYETTYLAHNTSAAGMVATATPSVAPSRASAYFQKIECFCFTEQTLAADETRDMPVRFVVDPALPADIHTVTLSYIFFKHERATQKLAALSPLALEERRG